DDGPVGGFLVEEHLALGRVERWFAGAATGERQDGQRQQHAHRPESANGRTTLLKRTVFRGENTNSVNHPSHSNERVRVDNTTLAGFTNTSPFLHTGSIEALSNSIPTRSRLPGLRRFPPGQSAGRCRAGPGVPTPGGALDVCFPGWVCQAQ